MAYSCDEQRITEAYPRVGQRIAAKMRSENIPVVRLDARLTLQCAVDEYTFQSNANQ